MNVAIAVLLEPVRSFKLVIASMIRSSNLQLTEGRYYTVSQKEER